jgi:hypothetical protein
MEHDLTVNLWVVTGPRHRLQLECCCIWRLFSAVVCALWLHMAEVHCEQKDEEIHQCSGTRPSDGSGPVGVECPLVGVLSCSACFVPYSFNPVLDFRRLMDGWRTGSKLLNGE